MHEFTPNATVLLIENHYRERIYDPYGLGPIIKCKIIATKNTDINGVVIFENEKLKTNKNTKHVLYVKNAWDKEMGYSCGYGEEFKNETDIYLNDKQFKIGSFQFQINNIFSTAIFNDSLIIKTDKLLYSSIHSNYSYEQGSVFTIIKVFNNISQPAIMLTDPYEDNGIFLLKIRKRKMGIVTTTIDTIKAYPNRLTKVMIDW